MKGFFLMLFFNACFYSLYAQQFNFQLQNFNVITGKITDKNNIGLPGVIIRVNNKKSETQTDQLGNFSIYANSKDSLIISYTGFTSNNLSLSNAPAEIDILDIKISIAYKNVTNVSGEINMKMSVNSFVFPPLRGYSIKVIPRSAFSKSRNLGDVADAIVKSLNELGYDEISYFLIPNGFAVVTRIEEINLDGSSIMNSERFSINESSTIKFLDFFTPRKGRFRLFAFLVTNRVFKPNKINVDGYIASDWSTIGFNILPTKARQISYTDSYNCSTLVYEFIADKANIPLKVQKPVLSADEHLRQSRILKTLLQH